MGGDELLLVDTTGIVLWQHQTLDTFALLPDSIRLSAGSYLWRVRARTGRDRWVESELTEFVVTPGSSRRP